MSFSRLDILLLTLACLALAASGCGYESDNNTVAGYQWKSLYRGDIHNVCVPIFGTKDFHRGVEFQLSEALIKEIEAFTPYKVVARDHAETILEGEVISVRTRPLSLNQESAVPQEQLTSVTVNFTWKDLRNGKILLQRKDFGQSTSYYPSLGEGQFVGAQDAAEKLAAGIVHEMEATW